VKPEDPVRWPVARPEVDAAAMAASAHVGGAGAWSSTWLKRARTARFFDFRKATAPATLHVVPRPGQGPEPYSITVERSAAAIGEDVASYRAPSSRADASALFSSAKQIDNSACAVAAVVLGAGAPKAASDRRLVPCWRACREITGFQRRPGRFVTAPANPCSKTSFSGISIPTCSKTPKPSKNVTFHLPLPRRRSVDAPAHARRGD